MARNLSLISIPNLTVKHTELTNNKLLFVLSNLLFDWKDNESILKSNIIFGGKKNKMKKIKKDINLYRKKIEYLIIIDRRFYKYMKGMKDILMKEIALQYLKNKNAVELAVGNFTDENLKIKYEKFYASKCGRGKQIMREDINALMHNQFKPIIYVGLRNLGNTCYMNSALQLLFNCDMLMNIFLSGFFETFALNKKKVSTDSLLLSYEFNNLAKLICKKINISHENYAKINYEGEAITPSNIRLSFITKYTYFNNHEEHDAIEFLCCMIDSLYEEMKIPILKKNDYFSLKKLENFTKNYYLKNNWNISEKKFLIANEDNRISRRNIFNKEIKKETKAKKFSLLENLFYSQFLIQNICENEICNNSSETVQTFNNISLPIIKNKIEMKDFLVANIYFLKNRRNFSVEIPVEKNDLKNFLSSNFNMHNFVIFVRYYCTEKSQIFFAKNNDLNLIFNQIKKNNIEYEKSASSILSFLINRKNEITDENTFLNFYDFPTENFIETVKIFEKISKVPSHKEIIQHNINIDKLPFIFIRIKYHKFYLFEKNIKYPLIFFNEKFTVEEIENEKFFKFTLEFQQRLENFLCKYFNKEILSCKFSRKITELHIDEKKIFYPLLDVEIENGKNSGENFLKNRLIFQREKTKNRLEIFNKKSSGVLSLGYLFSNFLDPTYAECVKCKNNTLRQNMKILKTPQYLIISINRFEFFNNSVNKINTYVEIPKYFLVQGIFYRFIGGLNHIQNSTYAHYTAYVYKDGGWWLFNDSLYGKVSTIDNSNIYCCLYEKINFYK